MLGAEVPACKNICTSEARKPFLRAGFSAGEHFIYGIYLF